MSLVGLERAWSQQFYKLSTHYSKSYSILCHHGNLSNDTSHEQVYKYCHPNLLLVHPLSVYSAS